MFGWLAQAYETMASSLLGWMQPSTAVSPVSDAQGLMQTMQMEGSPKEEGLSSLTLSSTLSNTNLATSAEWLSELGSSAVFEIDNTDVPVLPASEAVLQQDADVSMTWPLLLPALLLTPQHPVLGVALLALQQSLPVNAARAQAVHPEIHDASAEFSERAAVLEPHDVTDTLDVTEQSQLASSIYETNERNEKSIKKVKLDRHLQNNCSSNIFFSEPNNGWAFVFGRVNAGGYPVKRVLAMADGGMLFAGGYDVSGVYGSGAFLGRVDRAGNMLWVKTFGGNNNDGKDFVLTTSGDVVFLYSGCCGVPNRALARFTSDGSKQWSKSLSDYTINGLAATADNGVFLTGYTAISSAGDNDAFLIKLDSTGSVVWSRTLGGIGNDDGNAVVLATNGDVILTGRYANKIPFSLAYDYYVLLARFNATGSLLWANTIIAPGSNYGVSLAMTSNSEILLSTFNKTLMRFNSSGGIKWAKIFSGNAGRLAVMPTGDFFFSNGASLAFLNTTGDVQWSQQFSSQFILNDFINTADGGLALVGMMMHYAGSSYCPLGLIARLDNYTELPRLYFILGSLNNVVNLGDITNSIGLSTALLVINSTAPLVSMNASSDAFSGVSPVLVQLASAANATAFRSFPDAALMYRWDYVLPATIYSGASVSSFQANLGGATWLTFDGSKFSGTPLFTDLIPINVTLTPTISTIYPFPSFQRQPIVFQLCVLPTDSFSPKGFLNFGALPLLSQVPFNQTYSLNMSQVLAPGASLITIVETTKTVLPTWLTYNYPLLSGTPTGSVRNLYQITINVGLGVQTQEIIFVLNVTNSAPYFIQPYIFDATIGAVQIPLAQAFVDNEADVINNYAITRNNGAAAPTIVTINAVNGNLSVVTTSGKQGSYTLNITARDSFGAIGWQLITLNVLNTAPIQALVLNDTLITEAKALSYTFPANTFFDPDGDALTYSAVIPSFLSFNAGTRTLTGTPTSLFRGNNTVYLIASDPYGGRLNASMTVMVNGVPVQQVALNGTLIGNVVNVPYSFTLPVNLFVDPDGDPVNYALIVNPAWISFNPSSLTLSGTPISNNHLANLLRFNISDNRGGSLLYDINLYVRNTPPYVQYRFADPDTVTVGNLFTYNFPTNAFSDVDGDPVSYSANAPAFLSFNAGSRTLSGTPTALYRGNHTVYFIASDAFGGSSNVSIVVRINANPTQAMNLSTLTTTTVGVPYQYTLPVGLFSDADGDALSYELLEDAQNTKPSWLFFNPFTNELSGIPNANNHQVSPIRFKVSDGQGGQVFYSVDLVIPNALPRLGVAMPTQTANVNDVRTLVIQNDAFYDADGDVLSYHTLKSADGNEAPSFISLITNIMIFAPRVGAQGNYLLRLMASDLYGGTGNITFMVNVPNQAPMLAERLPPASLVSTGKDFSYSFPSTAFTDPDGDAIQYAANHPGFLRFDVNTRSFSGIPAATDRGTHSLLINVTDNYGGFITQTLVMTVNGVPVQQISLPTLTVTPVGVAYNHALPTGLFTDPDGDAVNYELTEDLQHPKPSWLGFNALTNTLSGTPTNNNHQASPILFTVSDGRGGVVSYSVSLVIPNSAPRLGVGMVNQTIAVNQVKSQVVPSDAFVDVDRDSLTYALSLLSGRSQSWLSFANGVITFFPRSGDQGEYAFRVLASDGYGGTAETVLSASVPNRAPRLMYTIPTPREAKAREPWSASIDADNFVDDDQDPLTYVAIQADDTALPSWLGFDGARRLFQGAPSGEDRGVLSIKLRVSDRFGGSAMGFFNVSIVNSAPVAQGRIFDQQVSQTETSFTFTVSGFDDPDGDAVSYRAQMQSGERLPSWLHFDASTRTFTASPTESVPGNYLVSVIAQDAQGQTQTSSFNLAIQAPPSIDLGKESDIQKFAQYIAPVSGGIGLLMCIGLLLMWRERRLNETSKKIRAWSTLTAVEKPEGEEALTFPMLRKHLQQITQGIGEGNDIEQLAQALAQFSFHIKQYYASQTHAVPMTSLLSIDTIGELLKYIAGHVLELSQEARDAQQALQASRLLHGFLDLLLAQYTGRGHRISQELKEGYYLALDKLMDRLPKRNVQDRQLFHELCCAREALICMRDTNTLALLAKASLLHLLSPGNLVQDIKTLVFDFPSKWYVMLLEMTTLAPRAMTNMSVLLQLQSIAAGERDWRFRFGMVQVLLNIMLSSTKAEIRERALLGKSKHLGFAYLLQDKTWRRQPSVVAREAVRALNVVSARLEDHIRVSLTPYLEENTRAERVEVAEQTNPLFKQRDPGRFFTDPLRVRGTAKSANDAAGVGVVHALGK